VLRKNKEVGVPLFVHWIFKIQNSILHCVSKVHFLTYKFKEVSDTKGTEYVGKEWQQKGTTSGVQHETYDGRSHFNYYFKTDVNWNKESFTSTVLHTEWSKQFGHSLHQRRNYDSGYHQLAHMGFNPLHHVRSVILHCCLVVQEQKNENAPCVPKCHQQQLSYTLLELSLPIRHKHENKS
jgi:hypothetical protein